MLSSIYGLASMTDLLNGRDVRLGDVHAHRAVLEYALAGFLCMHEHVLRASLYRRQDLAGEWYHLANDSGILSSTARLLLVNVIESEKP